MAARPANRIQRPLPVAWAADQWPVPLRRRVRPGNRRGFNPAEIALAGLTSSGSSGTRERLKPLLRP